MYLEELVEAKPGEPQLKTFLLSGSAGIGKSTTVKRFAYTLCQNPVRERKWDLVLILNVSILDVTESLPDEEQIVEAIRQSLEGVDDEGKDAIVEAIKNKSINLLLIPDGLNECKNPVKLKMLTKLIELTHKGRAGFTVLATCRTGLSPIPSKLFDRRIKIAGFTHQQGLHYIQCYYKYIQASNDGPSILSSNIEQIQENFEQLSPLVGQMWLNPLMVHIYSVVTADGTLPLSAPGGIKELLHAFEESMTKRQSEKNRKVKQELIGMSEIYSTEFQKRQFYRMCLYALLTDQSNFTEQLFQDFEIQPDNLYFTFMNKRRVLMKCEPIEIWSFSHEVFQEYLAIRCLETYEDDIPEPLLLAICQRQQFRYTQTILFSVLGGNEDHTLTLTSMVRATVLLQFDWMNASKLNDRIRRGIATLKKELIVHTDNQDLKDILQSKPKQKVVYNTDFSNTVNTIWSQVLSCSEDEVVKSQMTSLFISLTDDQELLKHLNQCLNQIPTEQREVVFANSIHEILPSTYACFGKSYMLRGTGGTRWSSVEEDANGIAIHSWSPSDACEAMKMPFLRDSISLQSSCVKTVSKICLCIPARCIGPSLLSDPRSLWGLTPAEQLASAQHWSQLLTGLSVQWKLTAETLVVEMQRDSHIDTLLDCLLMDGNLEFLARNSKGWQDVKISGGCIGLWSLCKWKRSYVKQKAVRVVLHDLFCPLVPCSEFTMLDVQKAVVEVNCAAHGGWQLCPFFKPELCNKVWFDNEESPPYFIQSPAGSLPEFAINRSFRLCRISSLFS